MSIRVLHLITGLETGGAETALHGLLRSMGEQRGDVTSASFDHRVVSLIRPGYMGGRIAKLGIPVAHLGMQRGMPSPGALMRLVSMLREYRPHVLQTWLYHADLIGLIGAWLAVGLRVPVVWNLRCSLMDFSQYPRTTAWTVSALAKLSRFPAAIVANSQAAADHHQGLGYRPRRMDVIPNGVDTARFAPDPEAAPRLRAQLDIPENALLAGMGARFDPMKDVPTLLNALKSIAAETPNVHLLLCGQGMDRDNDALKRLVAEAGLESRVHLAGHRADLEQILPGLDIYLSSSLGESFPNVIAEALACGVPVVATDAGASRELVAPEGQDAAGRIVPVGESQALGLAIAELVGMDSDDRARLGRAGRQRVMSDYSWAACTEKYAALYQTIAS